MNTIQINSIGVGGVYPIELEPLKDKDGNIIYTQKVLEDGTVVEVPAVGWYPKTSIDLIKNNLTSLFSYEIGQRFRQENFGCSLWRYLEEPNVDMMNYMMTQFIKSRIQQWESRIIGLDLSFQRDGSRLHILVKFAIDSSQISSMELVYDSLNNQSYANI